MKRSVFAIGLVAGMCAWGAGDPADYKKTVQRRVAPAAITHPIVHRALVDFGQEAFGFVDGGDANKDDVPGQSRYGIVRTSSIDRFIIEMLNHFALAHALVSEATGTKFGSQRFVNIVEDAPGMDELVLRIGELLHSDVTPEFLQHFDYLLVESSEVLVNILQVGDIAEDLTGIGEITVNIVKI